MAVKTEVDRQAYREARVAALKAVLKLTPAQEKNWSALESSLAEAKKARYARRGEIWTARAQAKQAGSVDLAARLQDRAKGLRARADQIEKVANAAKPLLATLDDGQKKRLGRALRRAARRRSAVRRYRARIRFIRRKAAAAKQQ